MHRPILFNERVLSDKLFEHCAKIDEAARNRMELIVRSLAEQNGVTEQLKDQKPNGMGAADERLQGTGRGDCESGIDLRLSEEVRAEKLFRLFSYLAKVVVELFTGFMVIICTSKENDKPEFIEASIVYE